jgi:hypothetical protein
MEYLIVLFATVFVCVIFNYRYLNIVHQGKALLALGSEADSSEIDWDNLGDKPAYPDTSDHGTADLAAELISLEVQVKAEQNTEKKSQLLSEIKEKYQLLLQLNVLHFDEAPAYADSFFDEDDVEEQPNNIINFAEKTAKLKPV